MLRRLVLAATLILASNAGFAATQGGPIPVPLPLFPGNNWWNTDISAAPVDPNSAAFITFIGPTKGLHPDFGGNDPDVPGNVFGFPYILVNGLQAKKIVAFDVPEESDGVTHDFVNDTHTPFAFYPIPDEAITMSGWVEGGQPGNIDQRDDSDRHILIVDTTNNTLYELYNVWYNGTGWEAFSGAFFDMSTNNRRTENWTSADAAGLAILPGLVRYDEFAGPNEITHAFRVTVRASPNYHVFPASHHAGANASALPMGTRLRLKASKVTSSQPASMQKIYRAMKKYGLIVADNGSDMYVSGTYDVNWNNDILNPAFSFLKASDFEVVQLGWNPPISFVVTLPAAMGNGDAATGTVTAYDSNFNLATGYTGTVQFTSTDGAATLPVNYTFTGGDAGSHTFTGGFTLRTVGGHTVTATDISNATITGSRNVVVGPPTPTGLVATAALPTRIDLSWSASPTATQYEIVRTSAGSPYATLTTIPGTSFMDSTVSAGGTYVYKVRAINASSFASPFTAPDAATTIFFTDDPAVSMTTRVKAVHMTEVRQAVNAMRAVAGLGAMSFGVPAPATGAVMRASSVEELRAALTPARAALGLTAIAYTDAPLVVQTTRVKAAHVQELRNGVR